MIAHLPELAGQTDVDRAWAAYVAHRVQEATAPTLADDPAHAAESDRLHAAFTALYDGRDASGVVLPFRRRG